jgi:hypothetical protein
MAKTSVAGNLAIHTNWLAAAAGSPETQAIEFPLFSDARFTDEAHEAGWPCSFLNTVPGLAGPGTVQMPVVVRLGFHAELYERKPYGGPSSSELYHGGWITDEIAALASLALGRRLRAGDPSRVFDGRDPLGRPSAQRWRSTPVLLLNSSRLVLPDVVDFAVLSHLRPRLSSLAHLSAEDCIALVRAARLYQDALWIVESEPNLAWLMLVSAMETAANRWRNDVKSAADHLTELMPKLAERLFADGGDDLVAFVARNLSHLLGSTKKFVSFTLAHVPDPPSNRPTEWMQVDWSDANLSFVLKKVYDYRSKALHDGTPFPGPMCEPPDRAGEENTFAEIGTTGLAAFSLGGTWNSKDLPISLHTFHHLARGTLLRWWDSMAQNSVPGVMA